MMAWVKASLPSLSTLHSWLLWVELVLLALSLLGLYAVISAALKRKTSAEMRSEVLELLRLARGWRTTLGALAWRRRTSNTAWASWQRRFGALFPKSRSQSGPADDLNGAWNAEKEADVINQQIEEYMKRHRQGAAMWSPIMFCIVFCGLLVAFARPSYPVVTEHHVWIQQRLDDGDFAYKSDEKPEGDTYRPCAIDRENGIDVDGMLRQAVGYVADKATWQERGICRSILKPEWQFWFRDASNQFTYVRVK